MTCPVTERSLATVACCYTNIFTSSDTINPMRNIFLTLTAIFFAAKADAKAGSSEISLSTGFSYFSTPHIRVIHSLQLRPVHVVFVKVRSERSFLLLDWSVWHHPMAVGLKRVDLVWGNLPCNSTHKNNCKSLSSSYKFSQILTSSMLRVIYFV